jgi:branched-chain amino acid transport system substrate-binding protein
LRADNFEPEGYTLFTYGTVQVWAQAVEKVGSLELQAVIASLRNHQYDTILGRIDFDDRGDLTSQSPISNSIWYVWKGGKYVPLE